MSILDVKEMTNDKCLMTKEGQNPNDERKTLFRFSSFVHSDFVRHSSFMLCHSFHLEGAGPSALKLWDTMEGVPPSRPQAASSSSWRGIPRNSKRRIKVSSIKLFGQEAPAVMPTTIGPRGSQFFAMTSRFSCKL